MKPNHKRVVAALALSFGIAGPVVAGEGHDHGDAPAAPGANGPQRLPDGSVFLPKRAQRQLGVRTLGTEAGETAALVRAQRQGRDGPERWRQGAAAQRRPH